MSQQTDFMLVNELKGSSHKIDVYSWGRGFVSRWMAQMPLGCCSCFGPARLERHSCSSAKGGLVPGCCQIPLGCCTWGLWRLIAVTSHEQTILNRSHFSVPYTGSPKESWGIYSVCCCTCWSWLDFISEIHICCWNYNALFASCQWWSSILAVCVFAYFNLLCF